MTAEETEDKAVVGKKSQPLPPASNLRATEKQTDGGNFLYLRNRQRFSVRTRPRGLSLCGRSSLTSTVK